MSPDPIGPPDERARAWAAFRRLAVAGAEQLGELPLVGRFLRPVRGREAA